MIEVLKQALEALRTLHDENMDYLTRNNLGGENNQCMVFARETITSLRQAIAEMESQEPVAWADHGVVNWIADKQFKHASLLYTHPPQRTWQGLTDEELRIAFGKLYPSDIGILELAENNKDYAVEAIGARHHWTAFKAGARAGEAKLKEKNNA